MRISIQEINIGTVICGSCAIAAVNPILNTSDLKMFVAFGTVFISNSILLLIFPVIGHLLNL